MHILHIDFEATSLNTKEARIIEIGALVTDYNYKQIGIPFSHLVYAPDYPELSKEVIEVTGITKEMLLKDGLEPETAFKLLGDMVTKDIAYVIAYNSDYDSNVFKEEMFRHHLTMDPKMSWLLNVPWLCGMADVEKNYKFKSWRLAHVALEHGSTVSLKDLHRAINDVQLMRDFLERSGVTPDEMYKFKMEPWIYVQAKVEKPWVDGGKQTDIAKQHGFNWERAKGDTTGRTFPKMWITRIKQKDYDKFLELPIKVERIYE